MHRARELREEEVHLGRGLGAGRQLELDVHAVEHLDLAGVGDVHGRGDEADRARRR